MLFLLMTADIQPKNMGRTECAVTKLAINPNPFLYKEMKKILTPCPHKIGGSNSIRIGQPKYTSTKVRTIQPSDLPPRMSLSDQQANIPLKTLLNTGLLEKCSCLTNNAISRTCII